MIKFRRTNHEVPGLNTSSLPDLIFSVLFFFMIVTHMRTETPRVKYSVPEGKELSKVGKKQNISYIYIGKPKDGTRGDNGGVKIQIDNRYVDMADITDYMAERREGLDPDEADQMTVSIKADRNTPMGVIADVRDALRKAGVKRINYSGVSHNRGK